MKLLLHLFSISLLVSFLSCNTTEPEIDITPAGRRDYEWTVDTLITNESVLITRMWGSSSTDIWAIATSSMMATSVWHFNGDKWSYDTGSKMYNMWGIYGFSQNEVWAANSESSIWRYNGNSWNLYGKNKLPGYDFTSIMDFDANSQNDIYGVGAAWNLNGQYKAIIIHYDGNEWKFIDIPEQRIAFKDIRIDKKNNILVIRGYNDNFDDIVYLWEHKELKEIFRERNMELSSINNSIYVTINDKIYKFNNKKLELWKETTGRNFIGRLWGGRSEKDFFWNTYVGLLHYNGSDFKVIYDEHENFGGAVIFEKDVFFITYDYGKTNYTLIIHGTLK